jgi:phage terminase large subunit
MDIDFTITSNFIKHFETTKRIVISQGSARSGKTFAILQLLIIEALKKPNLIISVVGENVPFLKRGPVTDFKEIMNTFQKKKR